MRALVVLVALLMQSPRDRALEMYKQRDFAGAAAALKTHLRTQPNDVASRLLLGLSYQQSGDLANAALTFAACPPRGDAQFYLARVLYEQSRLAEAEAALAESAKFRYPTSRIQVMTGLIRVEQARLDEALATFEQAKSGAVDSGPWVEAGKVLLKLNRLDEAKRNLEQALERDPQSQEAAKALKRARDIRPAPPVAPPYPVSLENVTDRSGVGFVLQNRPTPQKHLPETMTGGLAVFDFDNDGLVDIYFVNSRLYRNLGGFRFEDVTAKAGIGASGFGMGAAVADYDSDGNVDLFVAGVRSNQLFRNRGDGTFEDVTSRARITSGEWAVGGGWFDYDRDGLLDLFVVNYLDWDPARAPFCGDPAKGLRVYCHPRHFDPVANRLYRNRGDGTFEDVSVRTGIAAHKGKGMSVSIADGIFVPNDTVPNFLFRDNGRGGFDEVALEAGVALTHEGKAISGMGSDFRDYDNDGRADIVFTALAGETFPLFRGGTTYQDWTYPSGLGAASLRWSGWGVVLADMNNDGWKDLVTANSHVTDNIEAVSHHVYKQSNTVFLNSRGRFSAGIPFGPAAAHRGLAVADLDNDGRLDVVVTVLGERPEVWRNTTESGNRWLKVNPGKLGSVVRVAGQTNIHTSAVGYGSSVLAPVHFGLGRVTGPVEVETTAGRTTVHDLDRVVSVPGR